VLERLRVPGPSFGVLSKLGEGSGRCLTGGRRPQPPVLRLRRLRCAYRQGSHFVRTFQAMTTSFRAVAVTLWFFCASHRKKTPNGPK